MHNDDDWQSLGLSKSSALGCFSLLSGLVLLAIAGIYYNFLTEFEALGNPAFVSAPCCIAIPYAFFGKWVTISLIGLPGVWCLYVTVRAFASKGENEKR